MEFKPFPKIARLSRDIIITEKLDGTNAQIFIQATEGYPAEGCLFQKGGLALWAGSRNRWVTPENDNYGFAKWALEHADELLDLGVGSHYGEWWGQGIQRGYGLDEKRFSLFNASRWHFIRPECCSVVPVLFDGEFDTDLVCYTSEQLRKHGSFAAPGFMNPEGIVIFHTASNTLFKKTLDNDAVPKSKT